jgi:sec-independent protein translocase protein TatA
VIILAIVLIMFGPKRLPDLGRSLGTGLREFKDSVTANETQTLGEAPGGKPAPDVSRR